MENNFHIYTSGHINSRTVCEAMRKGTGFPIVPALPLQPGGVIMYGQLRGLDETLRRARTLGRDWYYVDRGYLCATKGADFSGYFRITKNAYQCDGTGESNGERFRKLGLKISPWKTTGETILVCPPGSVWEQLLGLPIGGWLSRTLTELKRHTKREIIVRTKQSKIPLEDHLIMAHAVCTHTSNVAVDSLIRGIPVHTSPISCAYPFSTPLHEIEDPRRPEGRFNFFNVLADNQFLLSEFESGLAWRMLKGK